MIRLSLLGGVELLSPTGEPIASVLDRPKRFALLAYLAARGPGRLESRDSLFALFWPETDQAGARQALNQALYVLRRQLGREVVVSRGDGHVGLAAEELWCDVTAFEEALEGRRFDEALRLYRGELLPGFYVSETPGFEEWLESERARLRQRAAEGAWCLAEEHARAGDHARAAERVAQQVALAGGDESAVQRGITLLDGLGNRSGALRLYEEFASRMAREFDATPSAETREMVEQIRRREIPASPVRSGAPAEGPEPAGEPVRSVIAAAPADAPLPAGRPARAGTARARRRWPRAAALVGLVGTAIVFLHAFGPSALRLGAAAQRPEPPRLFVQEVEGVGSDQTVQGLAGALSTELLTRLAEVRGFEVVAGGITPASRTRDAANRPAAEASDRAELLVAGRLVHARDSLRVNVILVDRASGDVLRGASIARPWAEGPAAVARLATDAAAFLRAELGHQVRLRQLRASAGGARAWELVRQADADRRRGMALVESGAADAAAVHLRKADSLLARAEAEAPGWVEPVVLRARVAEAAMWLELLPPRSARPRAVAAVHRGLEHVRRALARAPDDPAALELRAILAFRAWQLQTADHEQSASQLRDAEARLRAAVRADPARAEAWNLLGSALEARGEFAEAYWAAERAYEADSYLEHPRDVLFRLALTAYEIGADSVANRWCNTLVERFPAECLGAECQLRLLAWSGGGSPSAREAWTAFDRVAANPALAAPIRARLEMLVANVLGRAGRRDSAEAVIARAWARSPGDSELLLLEASARALMSQPDTAASLLRRYIAVRPARRSVFAKSRRFAGIRSIIAPVPADGPVPAAR